MRRSEGTACAAWLLLLLVLLLSVQSLQAGPVASPPRSPREEQQEARARALHPTCNHDVIMHMMQQSCQYLRRRRRRRRRRDVAPDPLLEGAGPAPAARPARSVVEPLFSKCCMKTCRMDDFVGVCP